MKNLKRYLATMLAIILLLTGMFTYIPQAAQAASEETPSIVQIAAGGLHSLALMANGDLYAWGNNEFGQLGDGTNKTKKTPVFIGTGFTEIAAGHLHSLALKGNSLYAWGYNGFGQLGDGTNDNKNTPVLIRKGITQIAAGGTNSLALNNESLVYTWGDNSYGQQGR